KWSLLTITSDKVTIRAAKAEFPRLAGRLVEPKGDAVGPATGLTPKDAYPQPPKGGGDRFGTFRWTPSKSPAPLAEVAGVDHGGGSGLFLNPPGSVAAGSAGSGPGLDWVWRVWTIGKDGQVALSETSRFRD